MEYKTVKCKKCLSTMIFDEENSCFCCPQCGYKEFIIQSDEVIKEKMEINAKKEIELGKLEKENEKNRDELQFRINMQKNNIKMIVIATVLVLLLIIVYAVIDSHNKKVNIDNIKMPQSSSQYLEKKYDEVEVLLIDLGFNSNNINLKGSESLTKEDADKIDSVSQISIDGKTSFATNTWFSKDAKITIFYHSLDPAHIDDIQVTESCKNGVGKEYLKVLNSFSLAGFSLDNINFNIIYDLDYNEEKRNGIVTEIRVNDISIEEIPQNKWVSKESTVMIEYHCFDPKKVKEVRSPYGNDEVNGKNISDVYKNFSHNEFVNIYIKPLKDGKKNGVVNTVWINNKSSYLKDETFRVYDEVEIECHSNILDFVGMDKSKVIEDLTKLGFENYEIILAKDLQSDELSKNENKVISVTIDGEDISNLAKINLKSTIEIKVHSEIKPSYNVIKLSYSEGELKKMGAYSLEKELENMGFKNVKLEPLNDLDNNFWYKLVNGFPKEGDIKEVSFEGKDIKKNNLYYNDIQIVIKYHSY